MSSPLQWVLQNLNPRRAEFYDFGRKCSSAERKRHPYAWLGYGLTTNNGRGSGLFCQICFRVADLRELSRYSPRPELILGQKKGGSRRRFEATLRAAGKLGSSCPVVHGTRAVSSWGVRCRIDGMS